MGRRIYLIGLRHKENTLHAEALSGLLQPPYSKDQFLLIRDQVWTSFTEEGVEEFGSLEMEEVLIIETTNASNVFMEQFHEYFSSLDDNSRLSDSEGSYWIPQQSLIPFLAHLTQLCQFFHVGAFETSLFDKQKVGLNANQTVYLRALYKQESKKRASDPEQYERKWAADYFNFSFLGKIIFKGLMKAGNYPFFMVFDA